ncbi:MAG TPA: hypothetical protein VK892_17665 [Pyrinomonadaceae bacterium]|nr:hypothetical protein [Pyrinomonadaceae bacterium]
MIKLPNIKLSKTVLEKLQEFQGEVNRPSAFTEKSEKAKDLFKKKNKKGNKIFDAVKKGLTKMCSGARRCAYCEDSVGDEVEHIRPKSFFPEFCFVWENYVYACGNCNSPKGNKWAVFRDDTGKFYQVNLSPGIEPPKGQDALINPRSENPMDYFILDFQKGTQNGMCRFVIIPTLSGKDKKKAKFTLKILKLNKREFLRKGREEAYEDYAARLDKYKNEKNGRNDQTKIKKMIRGIQRKQHPTVWKEMQRHYLKGWLKIIDEDLHNLFEECPEALDW